MSLLDRVRGTIDESVAAAQEGAEELQHRHELIQAYRDLGRRTVELIDAGSLEAPALELEVTEIRRLQALQVAP